VDLIRETGGITVWLDCPAEVLWARCESMDNRPLFRDAPSFRRLLVDRLPYYRLADFRVSTEGLEPAGVAEQILRLGVF